MPLTLGLGWQVAKAGSGMKGERYGDSNSQRGIDTAVENADG